MSATPTTTPLPATAALYDTAAARPTLPATPADPSNAPAPWSVRALDALQLTLAAVFIAAGAVTLGGAAVVVAPFGTIENVIGLGDWFRVTTGLLASLGGLLLCARATAGVGAVLLGLVVTGAAATELLVFGAVPVWPGVLLVGLAAVAFAHRAALRVVAAVLERNL